MVTSEAGREIAGGMMKEEKLKDILKEECQQSKREVKREG